MVELRSKLEDAEYTLYQVTSQVEKLRKELDKASQSLELLRE